MAKGKTRSKLSRTERLEKAFSYFTKGLSVAEVARKLRVTWDTAKRYEELWKASIAEEAEENPELLRDVVRNTVQSIRELDLVRAEAWKTYHTAESRQTKLQALGVIRQCQQDKAKLFGLFGVKQDFYEHVQRVNTVQAMLLEFLAESLCNDCRVGAANFMESPEVAGYMGLSKLPTIELDDGDHEEIEQKELSA